MKTTCIANALFISILLCAACARGQNTNASALELRPHGIQVALLIVDAGIQPRDGSTRPGVSPQALADPRRIADAALFLANAQHALTRSTEPIERARRTIDRRLTAATRN